MHVCLLSLTDAGSLRGVAGPIIGRSHRWLPGISPAAAAPVRVGVEREGEDAVEWGPEVAPLLDLMALPKAELHLHLEGTLEVPMVLALAERNGVPLPFGDADALRSAYHFANLQEFLDLYYAAMATLVRAEDFHALALAYYRRAAAQGVAHAEVFCDPQAHLARGVAWEALVEGLSAAVGDAERELGVSGGVIACFLRDRPVAEAWEVYGRVASERGLFLGVGLDSAEAPHPPGPFAELWRQAARDGLRRVAHAGEEGPPAFIASALDDLGVERVDHGVRVVEDAALLGRVVRDRVGLTMCPLSNVALGVVSDLRHHPLLGLLEAGALVSVHSDDPAYFGGYVGDAFVALREAGMTDAQAVALARNSVEASFAGPARKAELSAAIDAFVGRPRRWAHWESNPEPAD